MFYLDYHAIAQKHGSASIQPFVEAVLRARSDLDKSDVKTIVCHCTFSVLTMHKVGTPRSDFVSALVFAPQLEGTKRKAPEPEPEYPSIFSRLREC